MEKAIIVSGLFAMIYRVFAMRARTRKYMPEVASTVKFVSLVLAGWAILVLAVNLTQIGSLSLQGLYHEPFVAWAMCQIAMLVYVAGAQAGSTSPQ
jgi:hypothetical protein